MRIHQITTAGILTVIALTTLNAQARGPQSAKDSSDVVAVVDKFHAGLAAADSAGVLSLLAPDAMILETGGIQTVPEYRSQHLGADIRAAAGATSTRTASQVTVQGDAAWVVSTSSTQRQSNGATTTSVGAELMVLRRTPAGWRIAAIHWSSRARRPAGSF